MILESRPFNYAVRAPPGRVPSAFRSQCGYVGVGVIYVCIFTYVVGLMADLFGTYGRRTIFLGKVTAQLCD